MRSSTSLRRLDSSGDVVEFFEAVGASQPVELTDDDQVERLDKFLVAWAERLTVS